MNTWAKPGARCVCIRDYPRDLGATLWAPNLPKFRGVYTIRDVLPDATDQRFLTLYLIEVRNPSVFGNPEVGFAAESFQPLVTRSLEEDVALFAPQPEFA